MKKIAIILVLIMSLTVVLTACINDDNPTTPTALTAPTNVQADDNALITWDAVPNATAYIVYINGQANMVTTNRYQALSNTNDFVYSVVAVGTGDYANSPATAEFTFVGKGIKPEPPVILPVTVGIKGGSEIKSGSTLQLSATVTGAENTVVAWSVVSGGDFISIDETGLVTAQEVSGDRLAEVRATSLYNPDCYASKIITVVARPTLTQEMLDAVAVDKVGFEGYVNINLYTIGLFSKLYQTYISVVKTAMDGTNWYTEYEDASLGIVNSLYYQNHDGLACQVGVSLFNDELYEPMIDDEKRPVRWSAAGLYNNFIGLKVEDFRFDEESWRYVYVGDDDRLDDRMVAAANPYDFVPKGFSLLIEGDELLGIYSKAEDDYTVAEGYRAEMELFVVINCADTVDVKTIGKFSHDPMHNELQAAIDNMRDLTSYTLDFKEITASYLISGLIEKGFTETITADDCYFRPYSVSTNTQGESVRDYDDTATYGYRKIDDTLYNSYFREEDGSYAASRAFQADFAGAKPSFGFAAEIFRSYYVDDEAGTTTYYVDLSMCSVATTFFYGVGNDINLYGIFATEGFTSEDSSFTPYVTVKNGYIVDAGFYYYMGSMYGVVELTYSDFNTATMPDDTDIQFETRRVPTSWSQLTIMVNSEEGSGTADDVETNAAEYLTTFLGDADIAAGVPFFGEALGDTYGFGMDTVHMPGGTHSAKLSIVFYYDVPLDIDYTIESSLSAVKALLESKGFVGNQYDEYTNGSIVVAPVDNNLDLMIYLWAK